MLATAGAPPLGPGWTAEAKWDGARAASLVRPSGVELVSRPGNNFATRFPDVTSALQSALAGHTAILDGEIVALGNDGRPDFARLQRRLRAPRATSALRAAVPCHYFLFDCLHLDGVDLAGRPYVERRAALESLGLGREGLIVVPPCWLSLSSLIGPGRTRWVGPILACVGQRAEGVFSSDDDERRCATWEPLVLRLSSGGRCLGPRCCRTRW